MLSLHDWESVVDSCGACRALKRQRHIGLCGLLTSIGDRLKRVRVQDDGGMDAVTAALTAGHGGCIERLDLTPANYDHYGQMLAQLADAMRNERLQSLKCLRLRNPSYLTDYMLVADALAEGWCPLLESFVIDEAYEGWPEAGVFAAAFQARDKHVASGSLRRLELALFVEDETDVDVRGLLSTRSGAGALEDLQLAFSSSGDHVHAIAGYIRSSQATSLQRLSVMLYAVAADQSPSWAPLFRSLAAGGAPALQELILNCGCMDEEACAALGDAIAAGALQRLEVVTVRQVDFDARAWRRVFKRMARGGFKCPAFREIHVLSRGGDDGQADAVCSVVKRKRYKGVFPHLSVVERVVTRHDYSCTGSESWIYS